MELRGSLWKFLDLQPLLAQVKLIPLCLFEVMSLYTNAPIHSFEPVFKALVEILLFGDLPFVLGQQHQLHSCLRHLFSRNCSLIFVNREKSHGLKFSEYAGWPINLISWPCRCSIVCVMMHNKIIKTSIFLHLFQNRKIFFCTSPNCNCFIIFKRDDYIKTGRDQEKYVCQENVVYELRLGLDYFLQPKLHYDNSSLDRNSKSSFHHQW